MRWSRPAENPLFQETSAPFTHPEKNRLWEQPHSVEKERPFSDGEAWVKTAPVRQAGHEIRGNVLCYIHSSVPSFKHKGLSFEVEKLGTHLNYANK